MADVLSGSAEPAAKRQRKAAVAGLSEATCDLLRTETLHLAAVDGVLLGAAGPFNHAPCALLPFPLQASLFHEALALAPAFNRIVDRVSRDLSWLVPTVSTTVAHDPFTSRLLTLLTTIRDEVGTAEGASQPLQLSVNRSDYMIDEKDDASAGRKRSLLQVELNTISASFVSLAAKMSSLHTHLLSRLKDEGTDGVGSDLEECLKAILPADANASSTYANLDSSLPPNASVSRVAAGIATAHKEYIKRHSDKDEGALVAVVMIVQPNERNVVDQRGLEYALWREQRVPMVRATLAEVALGAKLAAGGKLRLSRGGRWVEASVAYFRAGYTPNDYPTDSEWEARGLIERSIAIKCPSLAQHLAGTKKVQQALAAPGVLERFASADDAKAMRASFAPLYGLEAGGGAAVERAVAMAIERPGEFVLKPQREGGGNNLYGEEMREALRTMSEAERASHILMGRIRPASLPSALMREGELDGGRCACELGVYGVHLGDGTVELVNESAGHLLRVKLEGVDEGGVCAGFAVLSSPLLC